MEQAKVLFENAVKSTETVLNRTLSNEYILTTIKVFLGLYAAFAAPKLPPSILGLFDNILFRIVVAFSIIMIATREPGIALMLAIAFIITLQTANKLRLMDGSLSVSVPGQSSWLPSVKAGKPAAEATQEMLPMHAKVNPEDEQLMAGAQLSLNIVNGEGLPNAAEPFEMHNSNATFTSQAQFLDAQSNEVPGAPQEGCVQTWANQHCIQGIQTNIPDGFDRTPAQHLAEY